MYTHANGIIFDTAKIKNKKDFYVTVVLPAFLGVNPIGFFTCEINWIDRSAKVSWDINSEWKERGREAELIEAGCDFTLNRFNLRRLETEVISTKSSEAVLAYGFKEEGFRREAAYDPNFSEYVDVLIYGVLYD